MVATDTQDVTDAEILREVEEGPRAFQAPVVRPAGGLAMPAGPIDKIVQAMEAYEETQRRLRRPGDFIKVGRDEFPTKQKFTKDALAYSVSQEDPIIEEWRDPQTDELIRVRVTTAVSLPNGRRAVGVGACSIRESRYTELEDKRRNNAANNASCSGEGGCKIHYAHAGDPKLGARAKADHDIVATADTRAFCRAVSRLLSWQAEVSAEEVMGGGPVEDDELYGSPSRTASASRGGSSRAPADGKPTKEQATAWKKLAELLGEDPEIPDGLTFQEVGQRIQGMSAEVNKRKQAGNGGSGRASRSAGPSAAAQTEEGQEQLRLLRELLETAGNLSGNDFSATLRQGKQDTGVNHNWDFLTLPDIQQLAQWAETQITLIGANAEEDEPDEEFDDTEAF